MNERRPGAPTPELYDTDGTPIRCLNTTRGPVGPVRCHRPYGHGANAIGECHHAHNMANGEKFRWIAEEKSARPA